MASVIFWQRLESFSLFIGTLILYWYWGDNWWLLLLWLLVDVSMVGYIFNARVGAVVYNVGHSYILPVALLLTGLMLSSPLLVSLSLIWLNHISLDRGLGYGLKAATSFNDTHLGKIRK